MSENPKRQHFIPQMILSRFAEKDLIWVYDKQTDEYKNLSIKDTAVITNYYRFLGKSGKYHYDIEKYLSTVEGDAKFVIDKLELGQPIDKLEKAKIAIFVAYQRLRVPDFSKKIQEFNDKMVKAINKKIFYDEEQIKLLIDKFNKDRGTNSKIDPKVFLDVIKNEKYSIVTSRDHELQLMIKSAFDHMNYFLQMEWRVVSAPKEGAFITSDNPFVVFPPKDPSPYRGTGIITKGAVKAIPLSKKIYLALFDEGSNVTAHKTNREHCKFMNDNFALNCDRFVYSHSRDLLKSVVERTQLKNQPARVRVEVV